MSRINRWLLVLGCLLAASLVAMCLCIVPGQNLRDKRPLLEVRNESDYELSWPTVASRAAYPNDVQLPTVAPHSKLTRRVEPASGDMLQMSVYWSSRGRIVSEPLVVANAWDYDLRLVVDSVGMIRLSQVPRVGADANAVNPWLRLILIVSGAIVCLVAPLFAALRGWQLLERGGSLGRQAIAFLMPPVIALVATLVSAHGMAVMDQHQLPLPNRGTPLVALTIGAGLWVLLVGAVNAACLLGRAGLRNDDVSDTRRGGRIVFALVHLAFMIVSVSAFVSAIGQRTLVDSMHWGVSPEQLMQIQSMDTWGTFGRLGLLAVGIYLIALIVRGDGRVPKYYMWYGGAFLAFEALLNRAQLELWDIPRGTAHASYAWQMAMFAAAMVGWVVYLWRSRNARETFVHESIAIGPTGRLLIGLGALALIVWPFIVNQFVDTTQEVAGRISPKSITAGEGFAQGVLAISVATGLLMLMKHAWRMRHVWITVLLPASFAALCVLYRAQEFMLHWTF